MKTIILFNYRHLAGLLAAVLTLLLGQQLIQASPVDSLDRDTLGSCNAPPVPGAGQTVTWTAAGSPYEICQNIVIPATSTVNVEPGVQINFDPDMQVVVSGTMRLQGQPTHHITLNAPSVFPPI